MRVDPLEDVRAFQSAVASLPPLDQVFDAQWFEAATRQAASPRSRGFTVRFCVQVCCYQQGWNSFLPAWQYALCFCQRHAPHHFRSYRKRIHRSSERDAALFELLVIEHLLKTGDPGSLGILDSHSSWPDFRVQFDQEQWLCEATLIGPSPRDPPRSNRARFIDRKYYAERASKPGLKCGQLCGHTAPIILVVGGRSFSHPMVVGPALTPYWPRGSRLSVQVLTLSQWCAKGSVVFRPGVSVPPTIQERIRDAFQASHA